MRVTMTLKKKKTTNKNPKNNPKTEGKALGWLRGRTKGEIKAVPEVGAPAQGGFVGFKFIYY